MLGEIGRIGKVEFRTFNSKYKQAYEYLAEMIFSMDYIDSKIRMEASDKLDEIFGAKRKC